ncbi:VOC family protein [Mycolicibacterium komossense]|uniref:VOC family protein n=1 Tax=Mycolicibacterium komossense TaxID=1779 RepID=A0ABT3C705_9MYCO|nr:VOC family protein [Mycolicibacterium komossense]MCV7225229.1 VOC family protein [Mycolicibacterium komossense]
MAFAVDRIDHIVINTPDVDITADWYVRVLGMHRETYRGDRTALVFGSQKFNVRPTGAPNWVTAEVDAPGSLDLCFIAEVAPEEIAAHLAAVGVEVIEGPTSRTGALGGMTSYYCRDPDGNLIEISSYSGG